tara:strand:- start:3 stop:710 length:708 start_codon:yes stop_codon:yes gene_type:complete
MTLFFVNKINVNNCILSNTESRHCLKVLRKKNGDKVYVTDGTGIIYVSTIIGVKKQLVQLGELKIFKKKTKKVKTKIAIGIIKSNTRFNWFLEKATEIGISEITPLICENSEKKNVNVTRAKKVLISALKQSKNTNIPKLNEPMNFLDYVNNNHKNSIIAHCHNLEKISFHQCANEFKKSNEINILIGPEGDFSIKEIEESNRLKIKSIYLSENILRTETAGIVSCQLLELFFNS